MDMIHQLLAQGEKYSKEIEGKFDSFVGTPDARVKDWPLMRFDHMFYMAAGYLILIALLRFLMSFKSSPLPVKALATLHNINLTALSAYMCIEILRQAFFVNNYSLFGNGVDQSPRGYGMARILYIFYLSKILEFIDTMIMAFKKNDRQISFLHLYHHSSIFFVWWIIIRYGPGGEAYFSAALNSFIHVLMYGYYLWSTFASKLAEGRKPHPFHPTYYKKYITSMQMTQFTCMLIQSICDLWFIPNHYPRPLVWILFFYMFTMLGLFANFFIRNYIAPKPKAKKA